ncbi:hypothetical protein SAMN05444280_12826 [Tangfeifania diversioriginum]|uniref:Uncharacterized protein n=1 Tax=Tangfeifania diversioriginum TaxID=1168035 RepID=A0A1M6LTR3_9BACT|nr:hypothetical protein [Tangfeifania diversioriginum]SHJ74492.1 hypothetical protein SAMN05444280_12826 [Tangfeifania diversioriginum]
MKTVQIELNKKQFIKIIKELDENDRFQLYNELKKSLFLKRFNKLLKSAKTDDLTFGEITREVESVRKERFENGRQIY